MQERWKNVKDFEPYYQVSNLGQVRRIDNPKYKSQKNYIIKQQTDKNGYVSVLLSVDGFHKRKLAHRLVAEVFISNPDKKPVVDHKDFDKSNNNAKNLDWVTQSENCQRAIKAGRYPNNKGEKHGMSKLKEEDVRQIKKELKCGNGICYIALKYGVSDQTIYDINKGRRWKHLK